jgi:hypothetical protein
MTDAPTETPRVAAAVPPADPLARLHHMSNTAGITSQEYVAINLPSVVALILGMCSLVVLVFHQIVLVAIPAAAIAFGVAALVQIRNSNGTQTGRPAAWAGIVLALLLGGSEVGARAVQAWNQQSDEQQVAQLFSTLGRHLARAENDQAYDLFTDRFKARISRQAFDAQWGMVQTGVARIKSVEWNGVPMFFQRDGSGTLMGSSMAVFHFEREGDTGRQGVIVRQEPSGWKIDDMPGVFPQEGVGSR